MKAVEGRKEARAKGRMNPTEISYICAGIGHSKFQHEVGAQDTNF